MELKQFEKIDRSELSMVEVAHAFLEESGDVYNFTDLLLAVQDYLGMDEATMEARMARFYTDLNVDGRFISIGENRWALRVWYPIDSIDEEIVSSIDDEDLPRRLRRKKKKRVNAFDEGDDDIIDYNDDDPEDIDEIYDEIDEEDYDIDQDDDPEDDDMDDLDSIEVATDDDVDDDNQELGVYARDLSELGDEDLELDDDEDLGIDEDLDEDSDDDEDDEEIYVDEE